MIREYVYDTNGKTGVLKTEIKFGRRNGVIPVTPALGKGKAGRASEAKGHLCVFSLKPTSVTRDHVSTKQKFLS